MVNNNPNINIIAAIGKNRELGKNNDLIWRISEDLKRFKALTTGHPIIMGRKTYESIGRPLPNRTNIVVTRNKEYNVDGCIVVSSLQDALTEAKKVDQSEIFILGGNEIFKEGLAYANRLYLTLIDATADADVYFPEYSEFTKVVSQEDHPEHTPAYKYTMLERA